MGEHVVLPLRNVAWLAHCIIIGGWRVFCLDLGRFDSGVSVISSDLASRIWASGFGRDVEELVIRQLMRDAVEVEFVVREDFAIRIK